MCHNFLYPVPFQSVITLFMSSQIICNLILKAAKDSSKIICKSKEVKWFYMWMIKSIWESWGPGWLIVSNDRNRGITDKYVCWSERAGNDVVGDKPHIGQFGFHRCPREPSTPTWRKPWRGLEKRGPWGFLAVRITEYAHKSEYILFFLISAIQFFQQRIQIWTAISTEDHNI